MTPAQTKALDAIKYYIESKKTKGYFHGASTMSNGITYRDSEGKRQWVRVYPRTLLALRSQGYITIESEQQRYVSRGVHTVWSDWYVKLTDKAQG